MPGQLVEALPVDILSHDTVEAKLLQPAVNVNVTLYEDRRLARMERRRLAGRGEKSHQCTLPIYSLDVRRGEECLSRGCLRLESSKIARLSSGWLLPWYYLAAHRVLHHLRGVQATREGLGEVARGTVLGGRGILEPHRRLDIQPVIRAGGVLQVPTSWIGIAKRMNMF